MTDAPERTRDYDKPDDVMLEQAQTMRNLFDTDSADFIALYTYLAVPFSANWQADIDSAQALHTSEEELLFLKVKTEAVEAQMELARNQFQLMASYVKILAPDSRGTQNLFGLNLYENSRNSQRKMYDRLQFAYERANSADYKLDLIALGFTQIEIDKLNSIAGDLYTTNEAQEKYKAEIRVITENRVEAYNKVWESMSKVSAASKQVYATDYAKLEQYKLYPEGPGGLGKPQNLTAVLDGADPLKVNIDFDAVVDALEYKLYKSEVPVGNPPNIWTYLSTSSTNHFDAPLTTGKRNYWKVRAVNTTSTSPYSDEVWLDA